LRDLTRAGSDRCGQAADLRQLAKPLLRLRQFLCVIRVETVLAVAGAVHHDLDCLIVLLLIAKDPDQLSG
jgi:hypothetical protein